jgi:hypothetical protein
MKMSKRKINSVDSFYSERKSNKMTMTINKTKGKRKIKMSDK